MTPLPDERLREVLRARTYSITDFGAYLRCPYSFAVERLLGLEMPESGSRELGPADFGNLLHWVLEAFGRDIEARHLNEEEAIAQWLDKALNRFTNARFGAAATLEVQVQLEQIRGRLFSFAHFQSARRQEGWAIVGTEESIKGFLVVSDGSKVRIKGRIDRIDKHEVSGVIAILDYKTSDQPTLAAKKHLDGEEWIDLQLPLCRYLWEQMHPDDQVEIHTGFVHLPQKAGGCKISRLELSDDSLTSAVAKAVSLVESIQALDFKPSDKVFKNSMDRLRGYGFLDLKAALDEGDET
jgi:ATP-dependent helicase/nuclease subunit B